MLCTTGVSFRPLLFILYTAELAGIAVKWNVNLHSYADDTQVLLHCKPDAVSCGVVLLDSALMKSNNGWQLIA